MGSLYTSIVPSLVLKGVGEAIAAKLGPKMLILNGYPDRETQFMTAVHHVRAICDALNQNELAEGKSADRLPESYITDVLYVNGCSLMDSKDQLAIAGFGLKVHMVNADPRSPDGELWYDPGDLVHVMAAIAHCGGANPQTPRSPSATSTERHSSDANPQTPRSPDTTTTSTLI